MRHNSSTRKNINAFLSTGTTTNSPSINWIDGELVCLGNGVWCLKKWILPINLSFSETPLSNRVEIWNHDGTEETGILPIGRKAQDCCLYRLLYAFRKQRGGGRPLSGCAGLALEKIWHIPRRVRFRAWIYRISLNTCINGQKRKKKESTQGLRRHHRPAEEKPWRSHPSGGDESGRRETKQFPFCFSSIPKVSPRPG